MTATVTSLRSRQPRDIRPMPLRTVTQLRATMTCHQCPQTAEGPDVDIQVVAVTHTDETGHATDVTTSSVTTYWPAKPGPGEGSAAA